MDDGTKAVDETLARITELARNALQAQATLARQSLELGRATLTGEVDRSTASRAYVDSVSREGARYWREASALGLDYAGELMALGSRTAARIISDASTSATPPRARSRAASEGHRGDPHTPAAPEGASGDVPADDDAAGRRSLVVLRGGPGQVAQATVTVVNRHPRARRVELAPSELRDATGTVVAVALRVDPERITIPAGGEYQVRIEADLASDLVRAGETYLGTVEVSGGDEATLEVSVEVAG